MRRVQAARNTRLTPLDVALNHYRNSTDALVVGVLASVVGRILTKCRDLVQGDNGFWHSKDGVQRARWRQLDNEVPRSSGRPSTDHDTSGSSDEEPLIVRAGVRRRAPDDELEGAEDSRSVRGFRDAPVYTVKNPRESARRAAVAKARNRPVGRPSGVAPLISQEDYLKILESAPTGVG